MILDFRNKEISFSFLMRLSGYKLHQNGKDYIKVDNNGRFHLKQLSKKQWDLHYDIDVDWRHFSMDLPQRCGTERKRIIKISYPISTPKKFIRKVKKEKKAETYADTLKPIKKINTPQVQKPKRDKYADRHIVKMELARIKEEREKKSKWYYQLINILKV